MCHSMKKPSPTALSWRPTVDWERGRRYASTCTPHLGSGQELKFKGGSNLNSFLVQVRGFTVKWWIWGAKSKILMASYATCELVLDKSSAWSHLTWLSGQLKTGRASLWWSWVGKFLFKCDLMHLCGINRVTHISTGRRLLSPCSGWTFSCLKLNARKPCKLDFFSLVAFPCC